MLFLLSKSILQTISFNSIVVNKKIDIKIDDKSRQNNLMVADSLPHHVTY